MNEHERDRIAAAMHQARPDWPLKSIRTMLDRPQLADRPRRDVFVALAWVACEPATRSPARVLEAGPWWKAAGVEGQAQQREPFDRSTFCGICGEPRDRCELKWAGDHEFESVAHAKVRHASDATNVPLVVQALRAEKATTPPEPIPTPAVALAWFAERLADEGMREAVKWAINGADFPLAADDVAISAYEADAALAAVRDHLGRVGEA